jgi:Ankyrin repeats (3 copies)/Ankyrin repeat
MSTPTTLAGAALRLRGILRTRQSAGESIDAIEACPGDPAVIGELAARFPLPASYLEFLRDHHSPAFAEASALRWRKEALRLVAAEELGDAQAKYAAKEDWHDNYFVIGECDADEESCYVIDVENGIVGYLDGYNDEYEPVADDFVAFLAQVADNSSPEWSVLVGVTSRLRGVLRRKQFKEGRFYSVEVDPGDPELVHDLEYSIFLPEICAEFLLHHYSPAFRENLNLERNGKALMLFSADEIEEEQADDNDWLSDHVILGFDCNGSYFINRETGVVGYRGRKKHKRKLVAADFVAFLEAIADGMEDSSGSTLAAAIARLDREAVLRLAPARIEPGEEEPAIVVAALHGATEIVDILLERGADIDAFSAQLGCNALNVAIATRQTVLLLHLVEGGADLASSDRRGVTPLMWAAAEANVELIDLLLARGAPLDATDHADLDALAHGRHSWAVVRRLLAAGARLTGRAELLAEVALAEADAGRIDVVDEIVARLPELGEPLDVPAVLRRLLVACARVGDIAVVERLLVRQAWRRGDLDEAVRAAMTAGHRNPVAAALIAAYPGGVDAVLRAAVAVADVEKVTLLLDAGAALDGVDESGVTVLMLAASTTDQSRQRSPVVDPERAMEVVRLLLARGADPRPEDANGDKALEHAGSGEAVSLLWVYGVGSRTTKRAANKSLPEKLRSLLGELREAAIIPGFVLVILAIIILVLYLRQ